MRTTVGALHRIAPFAGVLVVAAFLVAPPIERPARAAPVAARAPVTVSLTYDDGTTDQITAAGLMARHHMKGTFYLNSSRLGQAGRMTVDQAKQLQDDGNEIGGHTVTHADLPTLDLAEQSRQICNDRAGLLQAGFRVTNFAYPYGDDSPATQQAVAGCGYNSARVVGDVVSPGTCDGCPYADRLPPGNAYAIRTPDSVKPTTTLEQMENFVLQAEENGGGWVVLVMHRVCDDCDAYAVNTAKLDAFLAWLADRGPDGTVVRTVAEVIGGPLRPSVTGPRPAPRSATREMLSNTSMETDTNSDGVPDCWQRGGYGVNTAAWSAPAGHTGTRAQQVTIGSFTDGDRRIMTPQDLGACAPDIVAGHTYRVSGWYRTSGVNGRLVAYYRDAQSRWTYLSQGPVVPPNPADWKESVWTTPAMPAGSTAMSVGFSLRSAGFTAADDLSVMDSDQTAPAADLTSPADGSRVRGTVTFAATAADASGVEKVEFLVDGHVACTATVAPYRCAYDTTARPDTVIAVSVRATDTAGNTFVAEGANYTVSNSVAPDAVAPVVSLIAPLLNGILGQDVTLRADAIDNDAVSRVLFYAGDELIGSADAAPYTMTWNSRTAPEGRTELRAKAMDLSGNLGSSVAVPVTVSNYRFDTTAPAAAATCNGVACTAGWLNTAVTVALTATDDSSGVDRIVYSTDGADPSRGVAYTGPVTVPASATVKFRAYDRAGNAGAVESLALTIDRLAPAARVGAPGDHTTMTGVTYLKADVADANGIARVYFALDGRVLGSRIVTPYQWRLDTAGLPRGAHTVQVTAVDPAGNQTRSEPVAVTVP